MNNKTSDNRIEKWKSECLKHLMNIQINLTDYAITFEILRFQRKK